MSGYAIIVICVALAAALLWRLRMPPVMIAPALAAGLAGYAGFGSPEMPGKPAPAPATDPTTAPAMEKARARLLSQMGDAARWAIFSDALIAMGRPEEAIEGLRLATRAMPDNADLWVTYGNVLVRHSDGLVSPAARLAFGRASAANPKHPGPPYFLALAWIQAGEPDEALKVLEELAARTPEDAPWRPDMERMMRGARAMIAAGVDGGRFAVPEAQELPSE